VDFLQKGFTLAGPIYNFLASDHRRLDALLRAVDAEFGRFDETAYGEFRAGLLRHIAIEEKILMPAAQRLRGGKPLPIAEKIRLDHGALVALMVPPPTCSIVATLRSILSLHNAREENIDGLYEAAEAAMGDTGDDVLQLMHEAADVKILPFNTDPKALEATRRAVERAGYSMQ